MKCETTDCERRAVFGRKKCGRCRIGGNRIEEIKRKRHPMDNPIDPVNARYID